MSNPFSPLSEGALLQERYRVKKLIGKGGMGAVYEVKAEHLGHTVALKQNFYGGDEQLKRAFEREARLLANLKHPALPRVIDYFTEDFGQFLVMEFIAGDDLMALLKKRGSAFPVEQVLIWADQLLDALQYLHTQQPPIIHRDLKPQNLKLSPGGGVMLLDFGLAKGTTRGMTAMTAVSSVMGYTPGYAPLEQMTGKGTDERSDLYALGATLYHLLTNQAPPDAVLRSGEASVGDPDPLILANELNATVPSKVSDLLFRAMAQKRDDRPQNAAEMREELKRCKPNQNTDSYHRADTTVPITGLTIAIITAVLIIVTAIVIWLYQKPISEPAGTQTSQAQPGAQTNSPSPSETKSNGKPDTSNTVISSNPISIVLEKGVRMEFVPIRAGSFQMGSTSGNSDEQPVHQVTISRAFYMGKYEVTQAQWQSLMGDNPSVFGKSCGPDCPVDNVDWDQAQQFIRRLNAKLSQYTFRLPTEAEWEYAARAGTTRDYASELNAMAWYKGNSGDLHPVGQKKPNAWGLYDMLGNVWEWCQDRYDENYYKTSPLTDPQGPNVGESRVARGGSVLVDSCGPEVRTKAPPDKHASDVGFRVVLVSPNSQ